jgi:DNA-directed RNA polymerase specialized sigma24 family protein
MEPQPGSAAPENWKTVLTEGEEEEFREMIEPLTDVLVQSAKRDVAYYVQQDQLHENDLTPEEIAGETLYYAWEHRERRPEAMTLRGWLLGTQHRLLRGLVQQQQQFRAEKEVSLDAPVPPGPEGSAVEEAFWEWDQPTEGETTWEEVTPSSEPIDLEVPLHEQERPDSLEAEDYHVLSMHDEFEMSLRRWPIRWIRACGRPPSGWTGRARRCTAAKVTRAASRSRPPTSRSTRTGSARCSRTPSAARPPRMSACDSERAGRQTADGGRLFFVDRYARARKRRGLPSQSFLKARRLRRL